MSTRAYRRGYATGQKIGTRPGKPPVPSWLQGKAKQDWIDGFCVATNEQIDKETSHEVQGH